MTSAMFLVVIAFLMYAISFSAAANILDGAKIHCFTENERENIIDPSEILISINTFTNAKVFPTGAQFFPDGKKVVTTATLQVLRSPLAARCVVFGKAQFALRNLWKETQEFQLDEFVKALHSVYDFCGKGKKTCSGGTISLQKEGKPWMEVVIEPKNSHLLPGHTKPDCPTTIPTKAIKVSDLQVAYNEYVTRHEFDDGNTLKRDDKVMLFAYQTVRFYLKNVGKYDLLIDNAFTPRPNKALEDIKKQCGGDDAANKDKYFLGGSVTVMDRENTPIMEIGIEFNGGGNEQKPSTGAVFENIDSHRLAPAKAFCPIAIATSAMKKSDVRDTYNGYIKYFEISNGNSLKSGQKELLYSYSTTCFYVKNVSKENINIDHEFSSPFAKALGAVNSDCCSDTAAKGKYCLGGSATLMDGTSPVLELGIEFYDKKSNCN